MADRVELTCPCCATRLVVDAATGAILSEERPRKDAEHTFDEAMRTVQAGAGRREDAFTKAYQRTAQLDDLLNKKFEEARKKAAREPGKPFNPFDAD